MNTNQAASISDYNDMFGYWKNFRIADLKEDLSIYTKQMESQKNIQNDLTNQLRFLQKTLASTNPQIFDKTSYNIILESFTNHLLNLSNRIKITENLVFNLVNFFSNTVDINENPNKNNQENQDSTLEEHIIIPDSDEQNENEDYIYEDNDEEDDESEENLDVDNNSNQTELNLYSSHNAPVYNINENQVPDMTTEDIAKKVKEYLQLSKVGQRTFAEGLLNMRQANFSSLLSHPLPWSELSKTYRDRFLVMYHWLNDPDRLSKLSNLANKRKNLTSLSQNESKYSFSSTMQSTKIVKPNQQKRKRVKLRNNQKEKLFSFFARNQYPSNSEINQISNEINLPTKKVYTWFSNQRHLTKITPSS
ncbi:unnamed protein product [Brachionus calyciflorus]|uniref:One cut domain family member n=1 Tax=Brachionus calyciflorus TaxID=104777 RepID=A0A813NPS9_9BILA|nr:unnamed protein product [Brachionus calyciflorus]